MSHPMPYEVIITTSHGLNIILSNKQEVNFRSFSHFVSMSEAEEFAANLAQALENGHYTDLDRCPICGKAFTKQNRLSLLKDGRVIHNKCFWNAMECGELTSNDRKIRLYQVFETDAPMFDYSNLGHEDRSRSFRYAIQIVSRSVIHLHLIEPGNYIKHRFCLTYDECQGLIQEIRAKLDFLKRYWDASPGKCAFCGHAIYVDKRHYKMNSGEVIHGTCMERFIRSQASANVRFPATFVFRKDVFGHALIFGEAFDPNMFPSDD